MKKPQRSKAKELIVALLSVSLIYLIGMEIRGLVVEQRALSRLGNEDRAEPPPAVAAPLARQVAAAAPRLTAAAALTPPPSSARRPPPEPSDWSRPLLAAVEALTSAQEQIAAAARRCAELEHQIQILRARYDDNGLLRPDPEALARLEPLLEEYKRLELQDEFFADRLEAALQWARIRSEPVADQLGPLLASLGAWTPAKTLSELVPAVFRPDPVRAVGAHRAALERFVRRFHEVTPERPAAETQITPWQQAEELLGILAGTDPPLEKLAALGAGVQRRDLPEEPARKAAQALCDAVLSKEKLDRKVLIASQQGALNEYDRDSIHIYFKPGRGAAGPNRLADIPDPDALNEYAVMNHVRQSVDRFTVNKSARDFPANQLVGTPFSDAVRAYWEKRTELAVQGDWSEAAVAALRAACEAPPHGDALRKHEAGQLLLQRLQQLHEVVRQYPALFPTTAGSGR